MLETRRKENPRLWIKVCGLTRPEDVAACLDMGIDATGFIFVPGSPREISMDQARKLPRGSALRIGVFAKSSAARVLQIADQAGLDYVQLHGGENSAYCRAVGPERIIKVFWPETMTAAQLEASCSEFAPFCAAFLFDAGKSGGGSGKAFNWSLLKELALSRPWILAGGLNAVNLKKALQECSPRAIDLNSGVELSPGVKNLELIKQIRAYSF
jgi:phosphoribosylanthranilate isomerase